jgi:NTE family protein
MEIVVDAQVQSRVVQAAQHLPFEVVALVLQGGGALGAYQAGVYDALSEAGIQPNWIAGMSIGAINAAIIAGNAPNDRVDRLREFWMQVTSDGPWPGAGNACLDFTPGDAMRQLINQMSAGFAMVSGARGFFKARPVPLWFQPTGTIDATSVYDTSELKRTLERLVDFDRINAGATRLSVGAVNVRSGNFAYFDNATLRSGLSTLWRVARCRRAFPPSKSKASITGIAGWSRHAVAMGGRDRAAARYARLPGRPVERTRRISPQHL